MREAEVFGIQDIKPTYLFVLSSDNLNYSSH